MIDVLNVLAAMFGLAAVALSIAGFLAGYPRLRRAMKHPPVAFWAVGLGCVVLVSLCLRAPAWVVCMDLTLFAVTSAAWAVTANRAATPRRAAGGNA